MSTEKTNVREVKKKLLGAISESVEDTSELYIEKNSFKKRRIGICDDSIIETNRVKSGQTDGCCVWSDMNGSIRPDGTRSAPETSSFHGKRQLPVIKTTVKNLNLDCVRPERAGVILYTVVDGATFFGLGLDSRTHDLTDFGGGVSYKHDQNVIRGALREFEEETLQIFEKIIPEDIKRCPIIYDDHNLIIFIHLEVNPDDVCSKFNQQYSDIINNNNISRKDDHKVSCKKIRDPEVCGITWLNWEDFQRIIKRRGIMFSRVQRFLNRAGDFSYLL